MHVQSAAVSTVQTQMKRVHAFASKKRRTNQGTG